MSLERDRFRDALASWASGVAVVACRSGDERVVATTVSALMSLSLEPPLVLLALGPNATVRPFLQEGTRFTINVLAADQRRIAMIFADPFPVGAEPFPPAGDPILDGALLILICSVHELRPGGDHAVVVAAVHDVRTHDAAPLIRFRRRYHALES